MKTTVLISIILLVPALSWSQRPVQPIAPPPRPDLPNFPNLPNPPGPTIVGGDIIMPGVPSNVPDPGTMDTNLLEPTNTMAPESTNNNAPSPEMARALGLTNRLAVMAPAQVQAVTLLQVGLGDLQHAAGSISGTPNLQQVVHENSQVRQQLQNISAHIINLSRGPDRPSNDSVDRLSLDFLRASSHTQLTSDEQLVLAIVINLVVNCQNLPAAQVESSVNDGLIVLRGAGVPPSLCHAFGCDLNSIALEIQPNLGI